MSDILVDLTWLLQWFQANVNVCVGHPVATTSCHCSAIKASTALHPFCTSCNESIVGMCGIDFFKNFCLVFKNSDLVRNEFGSVQFEKKCGSVWM